MRFCLLDRYDYIVDFKVICDPNVGTFISVRGFMVSEQIMETKCII